MKIREAALAEERRMLSDHVTKVEAQRKEKEEQERKEEEEKLAATQVDMQHTPIPDEDVDMDLGHCGVKKAGRNEEQVLSDEQLEVNILRSMETLSTKLEDYLAMIQRCFNREALQEGGESPITENLCKEGTEDDPTL